MKLSSFTLHAQDFDSKLKTIKESANVDFEWYPYNSLNNIILINDLLTGGKHEDFFDSISRDSRVLDIGCADGDMAFFFESLGYSVDVVDRVATNFNDLKGCGYLKEKLDSAVRVLQYDVDRKLELSNQYGFTFALGILYHLRNPFYFLNMLCLHSEYVFLSTRIASHAPDGTGIRNLPVAYLVGAEELNNDPTNYWLFSLRGIQQIIQRAGFSVITEMCVGEVGNSTPHEAEKDERYFALLKRVENYKDIFTHHNY